MRFSHIVMMFSNTFLTSAEIFSQKFPLNTLKSSRFPLSCSLPYVFRKTQLNKLNHLTCLMMFANNKQYKEPSSFNKVEKARIVTSMSDMTLARVSYGKYATWVPDGVVLESTSGLVPSQTLLHIINVFKI